MAKLYENVTSVVETNLMAGSKIGQIKAQYPFAGEGAVENGMLLVEDSLNREIRFPHSGTEMCYLHVSEERIYESHLGREDFTMRELDMPKMMKLRVGDLFETNAIDKGEYADVAAVKADLADNAIFGVPDSSGLIKLVDATAGAAAISTHCIVLQVVEFVSLPNDREGIKFVVKQAKKITRLSSETFFENYRFLADSNAALSVDAVGSYNNFTHNITVTVPAETDVTGLIATFGTQTSTVTIDGIPQISGTTANDFTEPVVYTVTAEDGVTQQDWTVTVIIAA